MLREIVLDTETTGLSANDGDRLVEVGCVELHDRVPTGVEFHRFINPQGKPVHPDAEQVHGISSAFLEDKPVFADVVDDFVDFLADSTLVIHNAPFDIGFINMELGRLDREPIPGHRVVDTLALARRKHPAGPNSLDALCKRYGIDNSVRTKHGAIVDSLLLAEVYIELLGIRQTSLGLEPAAAVPSQLGRDGGPAAFAGVVAPRPRSLPSRLSAEDLANHAKFVDTLGPNPVWRSFGRGNGDVGGT